MDFIPLFFVCGGANYNKPLPGYENMRLYCPRCHNISLVAIKKREFFTFCFIPVIPTSLGEALQCTICTFQQSTSADQLNSFRTQSPQQQQVQIAGHFQNQQYAPMPVGRGPGAGLYHYQPYYQAQQVYPQQPQPTNYN
ncbi:hypothetical protein V1508DRAFT_419222 [Lipomyces doorenjongii]|uniref:uncharacterized protein n=1 Tax=Lipomyces doorenjongii TaxID=383834 RepID=UPI0034CD9BAE